MTPTILRDEDARSHVTKGNVTDDDNSGDAPAKLHVNEADDISDPAPFPFKPMQLAALLDPNVPKLTELGGAPFPSSILFVVEGDDFDQTAQTLARRARRVLDQIVCLSGVSRLSKREHVSIPSSGPSKKNPGKHHRARGL